MDLLVKHARNDEWLEERGNQTLNTLNECPEVAFVVLDLPNTKNTHDAGAPWWLFFSTNAPIEVRLVGEQEDEYTIGHTDSEDQPEYRSPKSSSANHEIRKEWCKVWGQDEARHPDVDLPCMLVKEEHFLDTCQTGDLVGSECQTHKGTHSVEDGETVRDGASQSEHGTSKGTPEHDWRTTPPGCNDNPDDTSNTTAKVSMIGIKLQRTYSMRTFKLPASLTLAGLRPHSSP